MIAKRKPLLEVSDLHTQFKTDFGLVKAVDGISFTIRQGQTFCVVGESGSGKSVMARSILQIVGKPGRVTKGRIVLHREDGSTMDIATLPTEGRKIRSVRGNDIAMIFQEPMSSLSPVHTIGNQIVEAIRLHQRINPAGARQQAIKLLERVGIADPHRVVDNYSFQLSGGMRQRAVIAMALSCRPRLLIADEPTTALDVTTQALILDLIRDLQAELGMAVMFITHDLGIVAEIADEVLVMKDGQAVEHADVFALFEHPRHPYTRTLLEAVPRLDIAEGHQA